MNFPRQRLQPGRTAWHITVGTYGSRLHGANEPTVDRQHNVRGTPFLPPDPERHDAERAAMRSDTVRLTLGQRALIEATIPALCVRGGWDYRLCAAPPSPDDDHFHALLDAEPSIHGKGIRTWLKRWLTEALCARFGPPPSGDWWVDGGSTKPVKDEDYLNNCFPYVMRQRTTPFGFEKARNAQ